MMRTLKKGERAVMGVINDNVSRRKFLGNAFMGLGLFFGAGTLAHRFLKFLVPEAKKAESREVLVGAAEDLLKADAVPLEVAGNKILLLKSEGGMVAFSRKCTDLGCLVNWDSSSRQFICPCHMGVYDKNGKNISGPPPRPLDRFDVVKKGDYIYLKVTA